MARFIRPRLTYFSFASCHVNIDHHDTPHMTSRTRPSSCFSACNIEKLGMGLGTRLYWKSSAFLKTEIVYKLDLVHLVHLVLKAMVKNL